MLRTLPSESTLDADPALADAYPLHREDRERIAPAEPVLEPSTAPIERHGYQPSRGSRIFGGAGTIAIIPIVLIGALVTLSEVDRHKAARPVLTVSLLPTAAPPPPVPLKVELPKPTQKQVQTVQPQPVASVQPPIVQVPSVQSAPIAQPRVDPKPPVTDVAPPPSPAAPAPPASHGPDKWEGRVLARLEQFRHYPPDARKARQQGTAYIRFRIDRAGHVLSSSLERSSGNAALDAAALETLHRADPLPKVPADRPDQIQLVVPIEFTLNR